MPDGVQARDELAVRAEHLEGAVPIRVMIRIDTAT